MALSDPSPTWSLPARVGFRFLFVYGLLYAVTAFENAGIPGLTTVLEWHNEQWKKLVPWLAEHVLRASEPVPIGPTGSGDTTFNYLQLLCFVVIAVAVTLVWSVAGRRARHHEQLLDILRTVLRYALALSLLAYGIAKIYALQMPYPSEARFVQRFGDFSPMGVLWTFMGVSKPYQIFAGLAEFIPGVLLFFRRTTTLGALIAAGVMTNVALLNYCYDVPVKLLSSHLVLIALFVALPDVRRLVDLLLLNRATAPRRLGPPSEPRWMPAVRRVCAVLLLGASLYTNVKDAREGLATYGPDAAKPPLAGLYEVEKLSLNGQDRPPLLSDPWRWRYLSVSRSGLAVQRMDGQREGWQATADTEKKTISLKPGYVLAYSEPEKGVLVVKGALPVGMIEATLRLRPTDFFLLRKRGFNWISELPFNR